MPRSCGHLKATNICACAIQHAYYSIKCIAESTLLWRERTRLPGQEHTNNISCYKLMNSFRGVIRHCLKKPSNRFLIICRDASVLINQFFFSSSEHLAERRRTTASQHITRVNAFFFKRCNVTKIERVCPQLIVFLSSATDSKQPSKFRLIQSQALALFPKTITHPIRYEHFFSHHH